MILIIDNYDSFTYNLVQYVGELGVIIKVVRNDKISLEKIERIKPKGIIISPGPGRPDDAGICLDIIKQFGNNIPILGVCLGHQCIAQAYGGRIIQAKNLMHGKTSKIYHDGKSIFKNIPNPFIATRYHSLVVDPNHIPNCIKITAHTDETWTGSAHLPLTGEIMGIRHKSYLVEGVQFHPESILTKEGKNILKNFLKTCLKN